MMCDYVVSGIVSMHAKSIRFSPVTQLFSYNYLSRESTVCI